MKNFKILAFALFLLVAFTGCEKKPQGGEASVLAGEWKLVSWNEAEPVAQVYIAFTSAGTFEIYQQVYTLNYEYYSGDFKVSGDIVTGTYADGSNWACGYKYKVEGSQLMLYSQEDVSIASVYEKCSIPEEIKTEATTTRSGDVVPFL